MIKAEEDKITCDLCYSHKVVQITGNPYPDNLKEVECPKCKGKFEIVDVVEVIKNEKDSSL